jgi:hypothetical protein
VEPTTNRAERALRFAVLWRKLMQGTYNAKGDRWVERLLSLRGLCLKKAVCPKKMEFAQKSGCHVLMGNMLPFILACDAHRRDGAEESKGLKHDDNEQNDDDGINRP